MADVEKKESPSKRITPEQRLKFIGFEVFPGKPKDLFKTDEEKAKWVQEVLQRREKGDIIRPDCKLFESRVSMGERIVLAVASIIMLGALLLPWFSAYTEVVDVAKVTEPAAPNVAALADSADSLITDDTVVAGSDTVAAQPSDLAGALGENEPGADQTENDQRGIQSQIGEGGEQIITGHVARRQARRDYDRLSGIGTFAALGTVGSHVFSGGFSLVLTGIGLLLYLVLCIVLPFSNLYVLFGIKGNSDAVALKMKKLLRVNWLPLILLVLMLVLSFFGGPYGNGTADTYTSIGDSYGPAAFLKTLSWGVFVTLAMSLLVALKAVEI
jgi:hypothetical protein